MADVELKSTKYALGVPASAKRVIATRSNHYGASFYLSDATKQSATYRSQHFLIPGVPAIGGALVFGAWALNPTAADITVRSNIHWNGKSYQSTWGGAKSVTITKGGTLESDDPQILFDPSVIGYFWVEVCVSVAALGNQWPVSLTINGSNGEGSNINSGGADLTVDGQYQNIGSLPSGGGAMYSPLAILGRTSQDTPTLGFITDSLGIGTGDVGTSYGTGDTSADYGYLLRATNRLYGNVWYAKFGDTAQNMADTMSFRGAALKYATHRIFTLGSNDLNGGRTAAQLAGDALRHAKAAAAAHQPFFIGTIAPRTTSTNLWLDTAGQTAFANDAQRVVYNTWVRDGAPVDPNTKAYVVAGTVGALRAGELGSPFSGWFDPAAAVESSLNSGVFKAAERGTTDAAMNNGSQTITSATANFTSADIGKQVLVENAAGASQPLLTTITAVGSTTNATLFNNAGATISGARLVVQPWVVDDVHWSKTGHAAAGAAIPLSTILASTHQPYG